jgi:hypothetical protein
MKLTTVTLLGALLTLGCSRPEVHLIPAGYQGDVVILPGYPSGAPPKRDGISIVFEIPPSGILITQDQPSSAWHVARYFYINEDGRKQRLEDVPGTVPDTAANRSDNSPITALHTGIGHARGVDLPCTVYSVSYYVGTRAHLLARTADEANAKDLEVRDLVKSKQICR